MSLTAPNTQEVRSAPPTGAAPLASTWVLLRGLSRESVHWGRFPRSLRDELLTLQPQADLVLMDLPGMGERRADTSPTEVPAIVEACRADLARRGVKGPVYLVGMSLGAAVVSDWTSRYPNEVQGGVLINASLRPFSTVFRRRLPFNYLSLLLLSLSRFSARRREAKVLSLTTRLAPTQEVLERWVEVQREHPTGVRNTARQLLASMRYRASRTRPGSPLLLLCSKGDSLVDWRCSQAMSRAWGAPLRLHTRAGHDLPLDDPAWVARAVGDWLRDRHMNGVEPGAWT